VETIGRFNFEAGTSISQRIDNFGPGKQRYETVNFPVYATFGFSRIFDAGFTIRSINHRYKHDSTEISGAIAGDFTSEFKLSPWEHAGLQASWRLSKSEDRTEELSIAHGNDFEINALFSGPEAFVHSTLNVGYVLRGNYNSQFGVGTGVLHRVQPGDIFQTKLALEAPIKWNLQALFETAYYKFEKQQNDLHTLEGSKGEAMDALIGLTWAYKGWNLGGGAAFGLLDERHTSFDLIRGAGDVTFTLAMAYKLTPHKPER
jgi:hypothetical protein